MSCSESAPHLQPLGENFIPSPKRPVRLVSHSWGLGPQSQFETLLTSVLDLGEAGFYVEPCTTE